MFSGLSAAEPNLLQEAHSGNWPMPPHDREADPFGEWLKGGGESGELIRSTDWSNTPLGARDQWPYTLRTVVNLVLESQFPMAVLWGRDLLTLYNDACGAIAGGKHLHALGRPMREIWPEALHIDAPIAAAILERGETLCLEDKLFPIDRAGQREDAYFTVCFSPVRTEDGIVAGSLVTFLDTTRHVRQHQALVRDIIDKKAAETRLHEREERLQRIVDAMELGDFTFYPQTGRAEDSVYAKRHLGLPPDADVDYGTFVRGLHPEDRDRVCEVVERVLNPESGGQCPPTEYRTIGIEDGKERWLSAWVHATFDPEGKPVRFLGVTLDITERKRAAEALERANELLREADRRKNEFLAILSHELRNPLTPIRNSLYLLERATPGGEQANRARQVIDRQVQHMTRLVDDLLDVTRITRGKIVLQRERVDLGALVRKTAEDYHQVYLKNGVELEVEGAEEELWVDGDRTRLAQIVGNLLSNSAKFTPRGGRTVVRVGANARQEAIIRVRDNGLGMTPATLQHLFEPFMQAPQTLDRTRGGLGLGLALVEGLIEMHGGKVTAHSEGEGKGSELTVTLPLLSPAERR